MTKEYVLGIDPGAKGAIAVFNVTDGLVEKIIDMPYTDIVLTTGKKTKRIDIVKLKYIFEQLISWATAVECTLYVHIEQVQAFGKQSAPAAFNFGYAAAIPHTLAIAFDLPVKMVHPATWKKQCGLQASAKDEARLLVLELFPKLYPYLKRKKDVDRADAILIAMYKPGV